MSDASDTALTVRVRPPSRRRKVGEGSYGQVWDHPQDKTKKIKIVQWIAKFNDEFERFESTTIRELTFLSSRIKHPCIIHCYESSFQRPVDKQNNQQHPPIYVPIVRSRDSRIDRYPLRVPVPRTVEIVLDNGELELGTWITEKSTLVDQDPHIPWIIFQVLHALALLERWEIVHNDLKPFNIVIDPLTKHVRIIDWGSVVFDSHRIGRNKMHLTQLCTYNYAAPEMNPFTRNGPRGPIAPCNDIFSWGMSLLMFIHHHFPLKDEVVKFRERFPESKHLNVWHMEECFHLDESDKFRFCTKPEAIQKHAPHFYKAIPMIERMLTFDHRNRPKASELLSDTYFDSVRSRLPGVDDLYQKIVNEYLQSGIHTLNAIPDVQSLFQHQTVLKPHDREGLLEALLETTTIHLGSQTTFTLSVSILDRYISLPLNPNNPPITYSHYQTLSFAALFLACDLRYHSMSWVEWYSTARQHPGRFPLSNICKAMRELMHGLKDLWTHTFDSLLPFDHQVDFGVVMQVVRKWPLVERYQSRLKDEYLRLLNESRKLSGSSTSSQ